MVGSIGRISTRAPGFQSHPTVSLSPGGGEKIVPLPEQAASNVSEFWSEDWAAYGQAQKQIEESLRQLREAR